METKKRTLIKTISWRIVATLITIILVYFAFGELKIAAAVGGVEVIIKLLAYYLHERVWNNINYGNFSLNCFEWIMKGNTWQSDIDES